MLDVRGIVALMYLVEGFGVVSVILLVSFIVVILRLASSTKVQDVDPEWVQNFSISSYKPMERLLCDEDVEFLRSQPGYELGMERSLRAARRRIFRMYLRNLAQDFNRLHLALRIAVLHSPKDCSDLASVLVRVKLTFFVSLAAVHVRIALHAVGVRPADVRGLIATLETMRTDLQGLTAIPMRSSAVA